MAQADYILRDTDKINVVVFREAGMQSREIEFGEFKRQLFQAADDRTVWKNLTIPAQALGVSGYQATPAPGLEVFVSETTRGASYSGLSAVAFEEGWQNVECNFVIPEDYKEGSDITLVLYAAPVGGEVGQKLLLEAEIAWMNRGAAVPNTSIETLNYTLTGVDEVVQIPLLTLSKSTAEVDSVLSCRVSRIVKDAGWSYPDISELDNDDFAGTLYVLSVGILYKADALGANSLVDKTIGAPIS